jgi:hypothetical protein
VKDEPAQGILACSEDSRYPARDEPQIRLLGEASQKMLHERSPVIHA